MSDVGGVMSFIDAHWPRIRHYIPDNVEWNDRGFGRGAGLCLHPQVIDDFWVHSRGGKRFVLGQDPPDSFFWVGIQNGGGSEYLFLMWFREGRRFWFYDQYVVFGAASDVSPGRTRGRLDSALERWESSADDVIYSGPWGWFDTQASRFAGDPIGAARPEVWEIFKAGITGANMTPESPPADQSPPTPIEELARQHYERLSFIMSLDMSDDELPKNLLDHGVEPPMVEAVAEEVWELHCANMLKEANEKMTSGGLLCLGGIVVTVATYLMGKPGSLFLIWWGGIIFGGCRFIQGLRQRSRYE